MEALNLLDELYLQIQTLIDEISNTIPGDINSDGVLNVVDVVSIVNLILAGDYNELADINDDMDLGEDFLKFLIKIQNLNWQKKS